MWNGRPHEYDADCDVCNLLVKVGLFNTPGKIRYLGEFFAGVEKVTQEFFQEDAVWTEDVSFPNYLAAWRCEVCGNQETQRQTA